MQIRDKLIITILIVSVGANAFFWWQQHHEPTCEVANDTPMVLHVKGGLLEVSTITTTETFNRTNPLFLLWFVPFGTTTAQIRVPAVYRYHVKLDSDWKVILKDKNFIVISPPVSPSLPVAIDTTKLQAQSSGVWSFITGDEEVARLQRSITPTLAEKAGSSTYLHFQREEARKALQEFVGKWLRTQEQWKAASSYPIRVFFADEPIQSLSSVSQPFTGSF